MNSSEACVSVFEKQVLKRKSVLRIRLHLYMLYMRIDGKAILEPRCNTRYRRVCVCVRSPQGVWCGGRPWSRRWCEAVRSVVRRRARDTPRKSIMRKTHPSGDGSIMVARDWGVTAKPVHAFPKQGVDKTFT